jgi:hypothetical protein
MPLRLGKKKRGKGALGKGVFKAAMGGGRKKGKIKAVRRPVRPVGRRPVRRRPVRRPGRVRVSLATLSLS